MPNGAHYLKQELYDAIKTGPQIFEFLQAGSLDGIWYWDINAPEHEWLSPQFWTTLGYNPADKQHLSSEWQDLIHPDDLPGCIENFKKHCTDPNHPYDQIVRYRHRDGSTVWIRCRGLAIRDANGNPRRMLGAHTDLTEVKRVELELAEKNRQLEESNRHLRAALERVGQLEELISVCSFCKKVHLEDDHWQSLESYISAHSGVQFSHGICPSCEHTLDQKEEAS